VSPVTRHMSPAKNQPGIGVVILGAGASSRMGRPKLLLPWGDTSVIGHIIGQWRELGAGQITVVHRPKDALLSAELDRLNFPVLGRIPNPKPERGMFSSVICAATWAGWEKSISIWAIVLGDQPHLQMATLRALLECAAQNPHAVCQPKFNGHARHPVLLPRQACAELQRTQAKTLKSFLQRTSCPSVKCPLTDPGLALDMDTPADYKQAKILLNEA